MGFAEIISDTYCGTTGYIAPEIIRGRSYDPRASDVWSLGVVLYVFLNKSLPFDDSWLKTLYDSQVQRKWALKPSVCRHAIKWVFMERNGFYNSRDFSNLLGESSVD